MIILFSGGDRTGKTEISNELSHRTGIPRYKCQVEQGAFNGSFIPEQSLIYEQRMLAELFEQNVLSNMIVDRGYESEYAYAPIFRKKQYDELNSEKYIWEYDKRFYPLELVLVYCYKTKYENYDDEVVEEKYQEQIKQRYALFLSKTVNHVVMVNTTDENLEKQVDFILSSIKKIEEISQYNADTISRSNFLLKDVKNCYSNILMPGVFYGDKILFVGQNPGQPYPDDQQAIDMHKTILSKLPKIHDYQEFYREYLKFELEHHLAYQNSKFYKFMTAFAKNTFGLMPKEISFTNVVKYATIDNGIPIVSQQDKDILRNQIEILKPKVIITFGRQAHDSLTDMGIEHLAYYHPAYFRYTKTELMEKPVQKEEKEDYEFSN